MVLAPLTAIGLTPPEFVALAAELGCDGVALNPGLFTAIDMGGPVYRLDTDPAMRRATARALADHGVTLDLIDSLLVVEGFSLANNEAVMDVYGELGATHANIAVLDEAGGGWTDHLQALCEAAARRGLTPAVEFMRLLGPVPTLADGIALASSDRYPGLRLMVDSLHLARAGGTPAEIAALDPALIGAAQICDGPAAWPGQDTYFHEGVNERGIPGEGELPLVDFLRAIPDGLILSPEVPKKSLRDAGVPIRECARRVHDGTRRVIEAAFDGLPAGAPGR
jgi:sugar phosphate isomerase/epimerase